MIFLLNLKKLGTDVSTPILIVKESVEQLLIKKETRIKTNSP